MESTGRQTSQGMNKLGIRSVSRIGKSSLDMKSTGRQPSGLLLILKAQGRSAPGARKVARAPRNESDSERLPQDGQAAALPEAVHPAALPTAHCPAHFASPCTKFAFHCEVCCTY